MRFPAALIAVSLLTTVLATTAPSTQHDPGSSVLSVGKEQITLHYEGCSANQSQEIEQAVKYAFDVVELVVQVRDNPSMPFGHLDQASSQEAAYIESDYFGNNLPKEKQEYITNVFRTLATSHVWTDVTYICVHSCSAPRDPSRFGAAYTMPDKNPMSVFICPDFLDFNGLKKIEELPRNATWSLDDWLSTGSAMLRKMLHLAHLLPQHDSTQPIKPIIDEPVWGIQPAYGKYLSQYLAFRDSERAFTNAENYALYALEVFVSAKTGWAKLEVMEMLRALWSWTGQWFHGEL